MKTTKIETGLHVFEVNRSTILQHAQASLFMYSFEATKSDNSLFISP